MIPEIRMTRESKLISAVYGLGGFSSGIFATVWELYFKELGYGGTVIGLYSMISGAVISISLLPAGYLIDATGRKRSCSIGLTIFAISSMLMAFFTDIWWVIVIALLDGVGVALTYPSLGALLADKSEEIMEDAFSMSSFSFNIAMALGSAACWLPDVMFHMGVPYLESYRWMILLSGILNLAEIPLLVPVKEVRQTRRRGHVRRVLRNRRVMYLLLANLLVGTGAGFSIPLIAYYMSVKFRVQSGPIGTMFMLSSLIGGSLYLWAPSLKRRIGSKLAIAAPSALSIPFLVGIPFAPSFSVAAALYVIRSALMNLSNPLLWALIMKLTSSEDRATTNALGELFFDAPSSVTSQLGGYIMDRISVDLPILVTAAFYTAYTVWLLKVVPSESEEAESS